MRTPSLIAALVLCAGAFPALAATPAQPAAVWLHGHDCLDPAQARGYADLDRGRLLVDAGRKRYLVEVTPSCLNLDVAMVIGFRGDPISNRVCGGPMDAVLVRHSIPCRIERMQLLSKEEYRQALLDYQAQLRARRAERKARRAY